MFELWTTANASAITTFPTTAGFEGESRSPSRDYFRAGTTTLSCMGKIDEPLDQIDAQNPHPPRQAIRQRFELIWVSQKAIRFQLVGTRDAKVF